MPRRRRFWFINFNSMLELICAAALAAFWKKLFAPFGLFYGIGNWVHWKIRKTTHFILYWKKYGKGVNEPEKHIKFYKCIPCSYFRIGILISVLLYFFYPIYTTHQYFGIPFAIGVLASIFHRAINE